MEYVSPEYKQQLNELAEQLVTPKRFSLLDDTIEFDPIKEETTEWIG
jgi:hypothetical protein